MGLVNYAYEYQYIYDVNMKPYPVLQLRLHSLGHPDNAVDVDAHLDTGAERSLFDGRLGSAIGINILDGPVLRFAPAWGPTFEGRLHEVSIRHPDFGPLDLQVVFSMTGIRRNLLGRDFFNLVQVGFRERYFTFFLTPTP